MMELLTERQAQIVRMHLDEGKSKIAIAKELGINRSAVQKAIKAAEKKLTRHPNNPFYIAREKSELVDNRTGESILTWHKSRLDEEQLKEQVEEMIAGLVEGMPKLPTVKPPSGRYVNKKLMNVHYFGDPHVNMLAWAREVGASWDLSIALSQHLGAMRDQMKRAPNASHGVLAIMGDLFHADSNKAVTPESSNLVDVDGRTFKAHELVISMLRWMVDSMLEKYRTVDIIIVPGNHSPTLERALNMTMAVAYEKIKRVNVIDNIPKHIPYTFGKNFLLFTHGDRLTHQKKADVAVGEFRHLHGAANFTHIVSGHLHHKDVKELSGCVSEIFQVLPTSDAWHFESGYCTADQSSTVYTYHEQGGIVNSVHSYPRIYMGENNS